MRLKVYSGSKPYPTKTLLFKQIDSRTIVESDEFDPFKASRFIPFYELVKSLLLRTKCVFKDQDLQMFGMKLNKIELFFILLKTQLLKI